MKRVQACDTRSCSVCRTTSRYALLLLTRCIIISLEQPNMSSQLPDSPWQVVGTDLFELKGAHYLLAVDYFSRYPELIKLTSITANAVIQALKSVFARHGTPEILRSDNGPQYTSQITKEFAKSYAFVIITSNPRYPQCNGLAERMVQSIKHLL